MRPLLVFLAALLLAPLSASAQVIHACVKSGGTLEIVADPADCNPADRPLWWNVQGPQAPVLHVFDALGNDLGLYAETEPVAVSGRICRFDRRRLDRWRSSSRRRASCSRFSDPRHAIRVISPNGINVLVSAQSGELFVPEYGQLLFREPAGSGCTGQPFIGVRNLTPYPVFGAALYGERVPSVELFVARSEPASIETIQSSVTDPDGRCDALGPVEVLVAPLDSITQADLGITFPVAAPLRIAPAPR